MLRSDSSILNRIAKFLTRCTSASITFAALQSVFSGSVCHPIRIKTRRRPRYLYLDGAGAKAYAP